MIHHSIVKTEGVDWEFGISVGSNKVTATGTYEDLYVGWLSRAPLMGSAHAELPALELKELKAKRQEGMKIAVTLSYESDDPEATYPNGESGKVKRYHMEPGAGEEPLLTNHLFKDLTDAEKEAANELASGAKAPADFAKATGVLTSEAGIKFVQKIRKGIEAYRAPTLVWVERFTTKTLDDVELTKILKTTEAPPGGPPSAGATRNWLRLAPAVTPNENGKTWNIENRWELSLPGKWDPDIYPAGG